MNLFIFCAILGLSSSLAFEVSFHTINRKKFMYQEPVLVCTSHKFIYHRGDAFTMYLQLANKSTKAVAVVKNELGLTYLTQAFWPEGDSIDFHPIFDKITIDVELSVNNSCVRERILEGRKVSTTRTNIMAYNDICLNENHCLVFVNPATECKAGNLTPLPCEDGRYTKPTDDQRSKTGKDIKSNPKTSRAKDDLKEGAENTYFIIMIVTSIISAVALILLLVIASRKCWWINPHGEPQILPINENPFYENVLFRRECHQEIKELEQREYDVVATENEYMEINNSSSSTD